jgi:hypothetical protein
MKLKNTKWGKWVAGTIGALIAGGAIMLGGVVVGYPAISQLVGLAVAQSSTLWNSVIDAAKGDSQGSGILGMSPYLWNGVSFDRVRGDTTNGMDVDVTRISGSVTPADAYANPTTANQMWSLNGVFNGTTWDRVRSATADALASTGMPAVGNMGYNGATWDRLQVDASKFLKVNCATGCTAGASTPTDAFANPTTAGVQQDFLMGYNGATWDRLRSSITNGLLVEKKTVGTSSFNINRANITTASVNLAFGFTSRKILITTPVGNTDSICIDYQGGTAACPAANTAGNGILIAGTSLIIDDIALASVSVIAASGTQTFSVSAWN